MTRQELAEAIPPAYTEFLGKQLIDCIENRKQRNNEQDKKKKVRKSV